MFSIVFQHLDFIVLNKPAGISVHRDDEVVGLTTQVAQQLGVDRVWLVHRLDKMTSGLLILALNASAAAALSGLFAQRQVEKFYIAISDKQPQRKQGKVAGDMQRSRRSSWKLLSSLHNPAVTQFFSAGTGTGKRLFIVKPATGKTHQIRVALKSVGAAILGDPLYAQSQADRGYLHAWQLRFTYQGECYAISALPECGEWFLHAAVLAQLAQWQTPWDLPWPSVSLPEGGVITDDLED
ncbi:MAG: TIGR01621 family pseudouridine synthase [Plesiomonas sp.]|uniref:TIGR01621 family pseudouridine synthase n=1 Tax=Plesiomonas sp. TaxID=2486279 RepID=UPI003EE77107